MILLIGVITIGCKTQAQSPKAYITNYGENYISVIDIQQKGKIADIKTGKKPHGVAISPDGKTIAVSNEGDNTVSIIDDSQNKVIKTIPVLK